MAVLRAAAYCRVSTDKDEQLSSLENQKSFFEDYVYRNGYVLYKVYADEGISGTKLKNRTAFNLMMREAESRCFDILFVKDISRFARNAVDFLQSIRELKALGIQCRFVNSNLSTEDGEFTLGILALIAQEESANLSKRVKFGKAKNAENGKVPNVVYGYNKIIGDLFNLEVNNNEAKIVKRIFDMYTEFGYGTGAIAECLNNEGLRTRRGCLWSQNAIGRILTNSIYNGVIINGREEVKDFLTGRRIRRDKSQWHIKENDTLKIISDEQFEKAAQMMKANGIKYGRKNKKASYKYAFSTLITCSECGYSFRRISRNNGKYIKWTCGGANTRGKCFCKNNLRIDENELMTAIKEYIICNISDKDAFMDKVRAEVIRQTEKQSNINNETDISKLKRQRAKLINMYENDIIELHELKERLSETDRLIEKNKYQYNNLEKTKIIVNEYLTDINKLIDMALQENIFMKNVVKGIYAESGGLVKIIV